MTTVVCWNMAYRRESWRELVRMEADIALLQEPCRAPDEVADRVNIGPPDDDAWDTRLWQKPTRKDEPRRHHQRWPKIARLSDRVQVKWFKPVLPIDRMSDDKLNVSDVQIMAAAEVTPNDGDSKPFIVVSMYATLRWPHPSTGSEDAHADASAHRIISDLTHFVANADRRPHRILAAGDLNMEYGVDYGWRERSKHRLWYARARTVWDRMEALDFVYMGPRYPNGRRADPQPEYLPADTKNVATYHLRQSSPAGAHLQYDHVFASRGFHETIRTRAMNRVDEWGSSDHCRLLIEVGT